MPIPQNERAPQRAKLIAHTFYPKRAQFITTSGAFAVWVMIVPENGTFDYEVKGEKGAAAFGELVASPPGGAFFRSVSSRSLSYHVLQWSWREDTSRVLFPGGKWRIHDTARLASGLSALRPLLGKSDEYSWRRKENLLEDVLLMAWEARHARPAIKDPTMREAARLLERRAGEAFSMSEISSSFQIGPVQFTRRFRACHGVTPIEYLTRARLQRSQKMLIETDATVEAIAKSCGYASGFYLSNLFARNLGVSPRAFRKLHRV